MMHTFATTLASLEPQAVWKHFSQLCDIPRLSKHERAASAYVAQCARNAGLEVTVDERGNVLAARPATAGMETCPRIILQCHLDMVGQSNAGTEHDFLTMPILPVVDGDWVRASGTTLGADNGIGVAIALAILEDKNLEAGPIDALFTVDEETGMSGAFALAPEMIRAGVLINLDAEEEGELFIGCAGGIDAHINMPVDFTAAAAGSLAYTIALSGLRGGHSGIDIHLGRGNALKLLNRVLYVVNKTCDCMLAGIEGGSARNAIPREAEAIVLIPSEQNKQFTELLLELRREISQVLAHSDPGVRLTVSPCIPPGTGLTKENSRHILRALYACPHGVIRMSDDAPGTVETSNNLAVIRGGDDGQMHVECLLRSSRESALRDLAGTVESAFLPAGATVEFSGSYPPWQPAPLSKLTSFMRSIYRDLYGRDPAIKVVHAGLETGIIGAKHPGIDMIAAGPTIHFPHSPDEKVHIESVSRFWRFLQESLKRMPQTFSS